MDISSCGAVGAAFYGLLIPDLDPQIPAKAVSLQMTEKVAATAPSCYNPTSPDLSVALGGENM